MTPKALFLDFDGTLVDSLDILYEFYLDFLATYGAVGSQEEFDELNGASVWEIMSTLKKRHHIRAPTVVLMMRHATKLIRLYKEKVHLYPETRSFLERMRAMGIALVVVTSANRALVEAWMERDRELASWFCHIITPERLKRAKPHPAIYERALDMVGIAPHEALVIEDAPHGMAAGVAASIPTVAMRRQAAVNTDFPQGLLGTISSWEELESTFLRS